MNTVPSRFYALYNPDDNFLLGCPLETLPIVWNRDGLYRVVPREVVENAVDSLEMWDKLTDKVTHPKVLIVWNQGIPISNQAGRALMGE